MKKVWSFLPLALLLAASVTALAAPMVQTEDSRAWGTIPGSPDAAMWDTLSVWTASGTVRCAAIGDGDGDTDTLETFVGLSASPRELRMFTPLTDNTYRNDLITAMPANCGFQCLDVGNCDSLPGNEVIFGTQQASTTVRSKVGYSKWDGAVWTTTLLDSSVLSATSNYKTVNAVKVADINADGLNEIIYAIGDSLRMLRYNASTGQFDRSHIWSIPAGVIYGMDIGDFDPDHAGIEIVTVDNNCWVTEIYWNGSDWTVVQIWNAPLTHYFNACVIGDFDPSHAGNEVAFTRYNAPTTQVFEAYGGSAGTWTINSIYVSPAGAQANGIVCGDFDATHAGNELAYAQYGTKQIIQLFNLGGSWYSEVMYTGGAEMTEWWGIGCGNSNPYHANDEVIGCNSAGSARKAMRFQDRAVTNELAIITQSVAKAVLLGDDVTGSTTFINNGSAAGDLFWDRIMVRPDNSVLSTVNNVGPNMAPGALHTDNFSNLFPDVTGKWTLVDSITTAGDSILSNNVKKAKVHVLTGVQALNWTSGFEEATFLAEDWDTVIVQNTSTSPTWTRETATVHPAGWAPYSGTYLARFNSYSCGSGAQNRLITPPLAIDNAGAFLIFQMLHDGGYTTTYDSIYIDISTDLGNTWALEVAGYQRTIVGDTLWMRHMVDLSAYAGDTIRIGFRGKSRYGNDMYIDDIHVKYPPSIVSTSPTNGATDVPLNQPLVIAYSEPMDTLSVLGYSNPDHGFSMDWSATMDTLTLTPDTLYNYNTVYTMYDTAGTDLYGLTLSGLPYSFSFTTIANQGPTITMVQQPGDTYDGTGPFLVRAVITDPAKAGIDHAELFWHVQEGAFTIAPGTPGAADTFDFNIPGGMAVPGQVISYYLYAEDDQGDGAYSPANAPVGVHQFRILSPLAPTALNATAGDMMVQLDWAPPAEELQYYDAADYQVTGFVAGAIPSTRFTPQHYPCRIEQAVSFWADASGVDSVIVHVYADDGTGTPGAELITPFRILPQINPTPTIVDLSGYNIVLTSGDFHIGYEFVQGDLPRAMCDATINYLPRALYRWTDGYWYADFGYDWAHSAAVSYNNYSKGLALLSASPRKGQKPNYIIGDGKRLTTSPLAEKLAPVYPDLTGALALAKNITGVEILRGDAPGGPYTTSLGTTPNVSLIDASVTNGNTYYYVARAHYSTPDTFSAFSNEDTASPAAMPILLVDDDCSHLLSWQPDRTPIYTAAVDSAGYSGQYTVYQTTALGGDGPSVEWFNNRTHVIWWTSGMYTGSNTLTANDETNLGVYLTGGGRLFLCGQDYLWDRYSGAGTFSAGQFPYDYLGLASVAQDAIADPYNIAGVAGSLAEGLAYGVIEDPAVGTFADNMTRQSVAGTYDVLDVTAKVGEKTGVAYDNGVFRTVFFTTLFEDITDGTNTKAELMYRILNWMSTGVEGNPVASAKPTVFSLANNYPNPVRSNTTIKFGLPKESQVRVEVYNVAGQRVKTLANGRLNAGYHQITWRGANEDGQKVAAGVYLVRMVTPEFNATRKMTVIR